MSTNAFLTSLLTWYIMLPSAMLTFAPMKNQIKGDRRKVTIAVIVTLSALSLIIAIIKANFTIARNALIPVMVIPSFILYIKCIKAPVYKALSVSALCFAFMSFIVNISNGFDAAIHPHGTLNNFSIEAAAFQAVIATVFALAAYKPALLAARIIDSFDITRVYIASVPVWAIFLAFNLLISPRKYETLHVNLMQIAYWGTLLLLFTLLCLLCVLFYYVVTDMMKKAELEERARILEMQESSYQAQQRYIEENARIRHDFHHVIVALNELSQSGDTETLKKVLDEYMASLPKRETEKFCNNMAVNAVLNHYMQRAIADDIRIDWNIDLSDNVKVSDIDICSIIGNILENAILACNEIPTGNRFIDFELHTEPGGQISIVATNSFSGTVRMKDGHYLSTRSGGHGIGLKSIASMAERYDGIARFSHKGCEFYTDLMFG